ncbi:MAG: YdcF family protein [Proteobacteria bacterium]|nr:YdcF family protein [Pseudomonadota bacterium]NBX86640.1 YdcF family protein [Pseudomonadota bacterium]
MKIVITTLLLPLGLLLLGLALLAWRAWHHAEGSAAHRRIAVYVLVLLSFGWCVAMPVTGQFLASILTESVKARVLAADENVDAIVVLTGGMVDGGPVAGWLPKPESIRRLALAYDVQRMINLRVPVIVSGGYTEGVRAPSEARVVAEFFARHRSEVTPTELEETSTDTGESALQLAPILAKRGAKNIILVTSDVHTLRALGAFRARGIDAVPFAALGTAHPRGARAWLPSVEGLGLSTTAVYEMLGVLEYLATGKMKWADITYN